MTRQGALTRAAVLHAALELIDLEGVDSLTMRRLAQRLDRTPMALYRHAASRDELLDRVVEQVLELLEIPVTGDWQDRLRTAAHRFRRIALDHPHVVSLLATRPLATPLGLRPLGTLRPLEQILDLLQEAGFAPTDALFVYRAYYGTLLGHVLTELQELIAAPDESEALLRLGLHRLPVLQFPNVRGLADVLAAYDGAAELDRTLSILLTGLAAQFAPTTATPPHPLGHPDQA